MFKYPLILLSTISLAAYGQEQVDFLLIGDYGWTPDLTEPKLNFDALNAYVGNLTSMKKGKIDFIMTAGDNLYVKNESYPTDEEADLMMDLFLERPYLKDLEIWPVLGNHDCYAVDKNFEVNLSKRYPTWKMPSLYHQQVYDLGHGQKLGMLFMDSCLSICSDLPYDPLAPKLMSEHEAPHEIVQEAVKSHAHEFKRLKDVKCGDAESTKMANDQYQWMNATLREWKSDPTFAWKATIQHHPIFGKWYSDYVNITDNYLPLLMENEVDFYLNGHEHALEYAFYPHEQVPNIRLQDYQCVKDLELFFGSPNYVRYSEFSKGDALHQVTVGSTGYDIYDVCPTRPSMGNYRYLNNKKHGFAHVTVTAREFIVRVFTIDQASQKSTEVYKTTVFNDAQKQARALFD